MHAGTKSTSRTIEVYDVLPPEPLVRRERMRNARPVLVEDAVFEIVPAGPRRENNDNPAPPRPGQRVEITRLAATVGVHVVNRLERLLRGLTPQAFATLIASLFFIVFWLFGGFAALTRQPLESSASPFAIERVFTEERDENGMRLLAVGGVLRNWSAVGMAVPELSVVGQGGRLIGTITPVSPSLAAGDTVRFFARFQVGGEKTGAVAIFPTAR